MDMGTECRTATMTARKSTAAVEVSLSPSNLSPLPEQCGSITPKIFCQLSLQFDQVYDTFQVTRHSENFDEESAEERCRHFLVVGGVFVQVEEVERCRVLPLFRFWDDTE